MKLCAKTQHISVSSYSFHLLFDFQFGFTIHHAYNIKHKGSS